MVFQYSTVVCQYSTVVDQYSTVVDLVVLYSQYSTISSFDLPTQISLRHLIVSSTNCMSTTYTPCSTLLLNNARYSYACVYHHTCMYNHITYFLHLPSSFLGNVYRTQKGDSLLEKTVSVCIYRCISRSGKSHPRWILNKVLSELSLCDRRVELALLPAQVGLGSGDKEQNLALCGI